MAPSEPDRPETTPPDRARASSRRRAVVAGALGSVLLIGLGAVTAWNLTRSNALDAARGAYSRHDFRVAVGQALDHLDRRPWSQEAARVAALALSQLGYADEAEPYYRRAGTLSADECQIRGLALLQAGRYPRAIEVYRSLLARDPQDTVALRRYAAAYLGEGKPEQVLEIAERLRNQPGSMVVAEALRAVGHHETGNRTEAVTAFERVLQLDPGLSGVPLSRRVFWADFAEDLVAVGRGDDARDYLSHAVAETPDAHLMCLLGRAYQFTGDLEEAERWLRRSAEGDPAYDLPHLYLGQVARQQGRLEEARSHLEAAFRTSPGRYETAYALALTCRGLGLDTDAERWQKRAELLRAERDTGHKPAAAP